LTELELSRIPTQRQLFSGSFARMCYNGLRFAHISCGQWRLKVRSQKGERVSLMSQMNDVRVSKDRCMALLLVQAFGIAVSILCCVWLMFVSNVGRYQIATIVGALGVGLIFSLLALPFHRRAGSEIRQDLGAVEDEVPWYCVIDFKLLLTIYAGIDVCVLAMCIFFSGGSQQSVFTPLLLTVVPVFITLRVTWSGQLWVFSAVTSGVLIGTAFWYDPTFQPNYASALARSPVPGYVWCYLVTTLVCALFPTLAYWISTKSVVPVRATDSSTTSPALGAIDQAEPS
jgi:hypothetical protein